MVVPKQRLRRPPSGRTQCCSSRAAGYGGFLPASREVAQLRSLLDSKLSAKEATFEVLRGLGTPVQASCGKRYAVVSAEQQPTLFEVLRSLDFKVDVGTAGKGATMTVEDAGCDEGHDHAAGRTSWEALRPAARCRPSSVPKQRASSQGPLCAVVEAKFRQAPLTSSESVHWKQQQLSARPMSARSVSAGRSAASPKRPSLAKPASAKQDFIDPMKCLTKPVLKEVSDRHIRPSSAQPPKKGFTELPKRPASARHEPARQGIPQAEVNGSYSRRPCSARPAERNSNFVVSHPQGAAPTLTDALGLGQKPRRPNFAPSRPTSAQRTEAEQRAVSARLAAPRPSSARAPASRGDIESKPEGEAVPRHANLVAEAKCEASMPRCMAMPSGSCKDMELQKGPPESWDVCTEGSQNALLATKDTDVRSEDYKPGAWHHTLQETEVFAEELQALQVRVDKRVESARRSVEDAQRRSVEDNSPSNGWSTPRSAHLEARLASGRSSLDNPVERMSLHSCGRGALEVPDIQSSMNLQAAFAQIRAGKQAFSRRKDTASQNEADPALVPYEVGVEMLMQPPELLESLRVRSQDEAQATQILKGTQPTQSLCYSRSILPDHPAGGDNDSSALHALESQGVHNPRDDGNCNCTMVVLENALLGGACQ